MYGAGASCASFGVRVRLVFPYTFCFWIAGEFVILHNQFEQNRGVNNGFGSASAFES